MNWNVIAGLVLRYTYLYRRSVPRMIEMIFWPVMDLLVWGFVTVYLKNLNPDVPGAVTFLLGAMIFWDIIYRSGQGVTMSFLEDVWSRNLLNIFVAPVRLREFLAATFIVGLIKIAVIVILLAVLASSIYHFQLWDMGSALLPFVANLLIMGWSIGMISTALILRYGQAVEALAWAIPFLIQPLAAVFYPVEVLPAPLQVVAKGIPATHVFEGMRSVLSGHAFPTHQLIAATALNVVWLVAAMAFFGMMFSAARKHGYLSKFGTQ
jgi:ABC-2 type transport system permease protein